MQLNRVCARCGKVETLETATNEEILKELAEDTQMKETLKKIKDFFMTLPAPYPKAFMVMFGDKPEVVVFDHLCTSTGRPNSKKSGCSEYVAKLFKALKGKADRVVPNAEEKEVSHA